MIFEQLTLLKLKRNKLCKLKEEYCVTSGDNIYEKSIGKTNYVALPAEIWSFNGGSKQKRKSKRYVKNRSYKR